MLAQLEQLIACPSTLWLLRSILANGASGGPAIDVFTGDTLLTPLERPRGLPIGNLTSQFLANLHLNAIDHRLRVLPGIRACLRYVDDLALFADRPEPLRQALVVLREELAGLRLRLHPNKTHLRRTATGVCFVGFHLIGGRIRLRNHSLLRIRRGLRRSARGLLRRRCQPTRKKCSLPTRKGPHCSGALCPLFPPWVGALPGAVQQPQAVCDASLELDGDGWWSALALQVWLIRPPWPVVVAARLHHRPRRNRPRAGSAQICASP